MLKLAFMAGSSKQGKAFLASVGCIWVVATTLEGTAELGERCGPGQGRDRAGPTYLVCPFSVYSLL